MLVRLTRTIAALLCFTLFGTQLAQAASTPTPAEMYKKVDKYKLGTCITIKEADGTEFAGRILVIHRQRHLGTPRHSRTGHHCLCRPCLRKGHPTDPLDREWCRRRPLRRYGPARQIRVRPGKKNRDAFCQANNIPANECAVALTYSKYRRRSLRLPMSYLSSPMQRTLPAVSPSRLLLILALAAAGLFSLTIGVRQAMAWSRSAASISSGAVLTSSRSTGPPLLHSSTAIPGMRSC